jgi:N-acetylglutamate synthase-like GNAT family acetyltransferase
MGIASTELRRVELLGEEIAPLVMEAERGGHRFMRRLQDEWNSGENRFEAFGEFLLSAHIDGRLVAVGGVNIDPYSSVQGVGRLRHVYVSSDARRLGVGTMLVKRVMNGAAQTFSTLRLRTTTTEAAAFYERLGFLAINEENATHVIRLGAS